MGLGAAGAEAVKQNGGTGAGLRGFGQILQRGGVNALIRAADVFNDGDGRFGGSTVHHQVSLQIPAAAFGHIDGGHGVLRGQTAPILFRKTCHIVTGQKAQFLIAATFRQALSDGGDSGRGRGDAGHN